MEQSVIEKNENEIKPVKREIKVNPVGVRIALPEIIAEKVQKTLLRLKERGADVKADELLSNLFVKFDEKYLNDQLEALTPASYYLELAKDHPQLLAKLIQQAKLGIAQLERGEPPVKTRKKRTTVSKNVEVPDVIS